ncbi:MAG TPA: hypothetical protein VM370_02090 [Candidatus Thermoplasmatota archaeon]|nr:hypothetical protein [Candidatus Thermoplasmatota archaeon]
MATTVRIQDEDKAILDALQARYLLATGQRISLDDLLHRVVELAQEHEDEIVLDDEAPTLTQKEIKAFLAGASDWGVTTSEDEIDDILYGGKDAA